MLLFYLFYISMIYLKLSCFRFFQVFLCDCYYVAFSIELFAFHILTLSVKKKSIKKKVG